MKLLSFNCASGLSTVLYQNKDLIVRNGIVSDTLFIDKMQKENAQAIGFIQRTIWDKYVFGGERNFVVLMCEVNFDPVGYVLITPGKELGDYAKIQQIVIRNDARRLEYGKALIDVCQRLCEQIGRRGISLRCRSDLESNIFWQALGFENYAVWEKGKINHVNFHASLDIRLWKKDINSMMPVLL